MQFINMRELSRSPAKYVKLANEENDIIITRNGHPYALLSKIDGDELEDFILAKHYDLEKEFTVAQKEHSEGKTRDLQDLLGEIDKEIADGV